MQIAIADDASLFREGLIMLIHSAGSEVTVAARTGTELYARLAQQPAPDAVILDMHMPPTYTNEGLAAAAAIHDLHPSAAILVLSTYAETEYAAELLETLPSGSGYLLKDRVADVDVLLDAIERILSGESVIDSEIVRQLMVRQRRSSVFLELTPRERDVLTLIASGRSNAGIARQLHLSPKTVERHISAILIHLGLSDNSDDNRRVLAVLAWLQGYHDPPENARSETP